MILFAVKNLDKDVSKCIFRINKRQVPLYKEKYKNYIYLYLYNKKASDDKLYAQAESFIEGKTYYVLKGSNNILVDNYEEAISIACKDFYYIKTFNNVIDAKDYIKLKITKDERKNIFNNIFTNKDCLNLYRKILLNDVLCFLDVGWNNKSEIISIGIVKHNFKKNETDIFYKTTTNAVNFIKGSKYTIINNYEVGVVKNQEKLLEYAIKFIDNHYVLTWGVQDKMMLSRISKSPNNLLNNIYNVQPIVGTYIKPKQPILSLNVVKQKYSLSGKVKHHSLSDSFDLYKVIKAFRSFIIRREVLHINKK